MEALEVSTQVCVVGGMIDATLRHRNDPLIPLILLQLKVLLLVPGSGSTVSTRVLVLVS